MPYFIITAGATGAGKTSLIEKTMQHLGLHEDYVTILIDDLVEQNAVYKKKMIGIATFFDGNSYHLTKNKPITPPLELSATPHVDVYQKSVNE